MLRKFLTYRPHESAGIAGLQRSVWTGALGHVLTHLPLRSAARNGFDGCSDNMSRVRSGLLCLALFSILWVLCLVLEGSGFLRRCAPRRSLGAVLWIIMVPCGSLTLPMFWVETKDCFVILSLGVVWNGVLLGKPRGDMFFAFVEVLMEMVTCSGIASMRHATRLIGGFMPACPGC